MIEDKLLADFIFRLKQDAAERLEEAVDASPMSAHVALAETMLAHLNEAGLVPEADLSPHEDVEGRNRCRLIAWSLPEDSTRLELFTAWDAGDDAGAHLPQLDVERLAHRAARFAGYALKQDVRRFADSQAANAAAQAIHRQRDSIDDVRVHLLTNALVKDREATQGMEVERRPVIFSIWDAERLYRVVAEGFNRDLIDVDFTKLLGRPIACLEMKPAPKEYQTFLLVLPGELVADLYSEYGARLFEFNVRSFLQAKGNVNKGMRRTIDDEPERFLAYNNGLTATADEIEVGQWHGETAIHRLRGLQIVNGAQTTASIHRARTDKTGKRDVSRVAVAMKLTRVLPEKLKEFIPKISEYANTQNPVQVADLSANSDFQVEMERLSERVWCPGEGTRWFYERARGAYQVARARYGTTDMKRAEFDREHPKQKTFGKTDLARYLMSWWGHPHVVSRGTQKNFATFLKELKQKKGEAWTPDVGFFMGVAAAAIINKTAQDVVRRAIRRKEFTSYGANVVTYMVARLGWQYRKFDMDLVWKNQAVSAPLVQLMEVWAPEIHAEILLRAGKDNVTEFAKKDACWAAVQELDLPEASVLLPEHGEEGTEEEILEPVQAEALKKNDVDICCELDAQQWGLVMAWSAGSSRVASYDRDVAHTISGLALKGWRKKPTEKQAVFGARVVVAARQAGVLEDT